MTVKGAVLYLITLMIVGIYFSDFYEKIFDNNGFWAIISIISITALVAYTAYGIYTNKKKHKEE